MAEGGGSNGAEGSNAARGRWNALAENSRQRRPKGVEGTVRFRTSFHNVVYDVFRARAWKETDSDVDWDVCWADTGAPRKYRTCHCAHASHVHLVPCTARRTAQIIRRTSCRSAAQARSTYHLRSPPARAGWIRENFDTSETEHVGDIFADGKERRPSNPRAKIEPLATAENHAFKTMVV